jgi:hypothetical protein
MEDRTARRLRRRFRLEIEILEELGHEITGPPEPLQEPPTSEGFRWRLIGGNAAFPCSRCGRRITRRDLWDSQEPCPGDFG